jgi:hypothetical protein
MKQNNIYRCGQSVAILAILGAASARAEEASATLDHAVGDRTSRDIEVQPGDRITLTISNTCPDRFDYEHVVFESSPAEPDVEDNKALGDGEKKCSPEEARKKLNSEGYCELKTRSLSFTHERNARAYEILVGPKPNSPAVVRGLKLADFASTATAMTNVAGCAVPKETEKKAVELTKARFLVNVQRSSWALGMSGGLTISDVVDPRFAVIADPASTATPPTKIVVRDRDAEDSQKLGFAGFLHVHNDKWQPFGVPIAGTFGLGMQDNNSINGFLGVSAAAFDLAYLTLGWNWSSVERLPAGQRVGAAPINDNVLNNMPRKTDTGWFLGISFKLMSPGESFFKEKIRPKEVKAEPAPKQ